MGLLGALAGAAGTLLLGRTFLLETETQSGIPRLILVIDAVTDEEPVYEALVTQHPVEDGPEVTDHIQLKNPTLTIRGTVSNTPIDLSNTVGNLLAGGIGMATSSQFQANFLNSGVQQAAGMVGGKLMGSAGMSAGGVLAAALDAIARAALLSAFERKARFDVVTKRQRHTGMVIQKLSFPRDKETGYALMFEMDMIHIRVVSPLAIKLGSVAGSVANSAISKVGLGNQASLAASVTG